MEPLFSRAIHSVSAGEQDTHSINIPCVSWRTRHTLHQYSVCQLENKTHTSSILCVSAGEQDTHSINIPYVSWRTRHTLHQYYVCHLALHYMCQYENKTTHFISSLCISKRTRIYTPSILYASAGKQDHTLHQYSMCQLANKSAHSISILCISWRTRPHTPSVFHVSAGEQDHSLHQYSVCQ